MELTVAKKDLLKIVARMQGVAERKSTMPVLANVLLSARDSRLAITGTDLEVELVAATQVGLEQQGDITVPGRKLLDIFRACGALLEGHFILSSGLRSPVFLQKARVFMHPDQAEKLCRALAAKLKAEGYGSVGQVVSPAVGGIIPGYETARHLGVPAIYTERVDGKFQLRRGFEIARGEKVLVVEDIVTTGLSIRECIACLR